MVFQTRFLESRKLSANFLFGLGILFFQGCSEPGSSDVRLAVSSQNQNQKHGLVQSPHASTSEDPEFVPWTTKEEKGGAFLCSGEIRTISFPIEKRWSNSVGSNSISLDGEQSVELELYQVSRWSSPPAELIGEANPPLFRQRYHSHRFFDAGISVVSLDRAIEITKEDSVAEFYPIERSGAWHQPYFERDLSYWLRFRADGDEGRRNFKTVGVFDRPTGVPIDTGTGHFEKPEGLSLFRFKYPFWHEGGVDLVFDLFKNETTRQDHEIREGEIYSMGGFSVQVLLFREGRWEKKLVGDETPSSEPTLESYLLTKVSDGGTTLFLVTDGSVPSTDWNIEVIGADGRSRSRVPRSNQLLYHHYRENKPELEKLRLIRGPDRDRITFHLPGVPSLPENNGKVKNYFDQTVPFFYAEDAYRMLEGLSRLLAVEYKRPKQIPKKPEGFPLAMRDATVKELLDQLRILLEPAGFGVELQKETLQWEFPTLKSDSIE